MMKKCMLFAMAALMGLGVWAQEVEETTIAVGDLTVPAYRVTLNKDAKMVQAAMNQRLKDAKLKTKNTDGYVACIQQVFTEVAATPVNLYTKVEEQGRKSDRTVAVTVSALSSDLTIDQVSMNNNVRLFVAGFSQYVDQYEARTQLAAQQEVLKKAKKVQAAAMADLSAVEKSLKSDQKAVTKKQKEVEKLNAKAAKLEAEIQKLEAGFDKYADKRAAAEGKVREADEAVNAAQAEVDRLSSQLK